MMPIKDIDDVHEFLNGIPSFRSEGKQAADFSLDRFANFCEAIGNPHNQFPSVHVAGSNGKGSTCQLIASVYSRAGYHTGAYTSPHIISFNERFTLNGKRISDEELVHFFQIHLPLMKSFRLTYFEISTAVAFWWFAREQVDVAVIEAGLGGRLDATNLITPLAALITTVALDHTDILGDSLEAIAAEKAGIIKPEVPVILGNVPQKARPVILNEAKKKQAAIYESMRLNPQWIDGECRLAIDGRQVHIQSPFRAPIQVYNLAAAWLLTTVLQNELPVTEENRIKGMEGVGALFPNIARFERLDEQLNWYFDGAHNLQAVRAMKKTVETIQPVEQTILVLSLMRDKITKKLMKEFLEFEKIIYHTLPLGRAASIDDIQQWSSKIQSFPVKQGSRIKLLKELESELVIFAGSFYFYSTVRDWLSTYMIDC